MADAGGEPAGHRRYVLKGPLYGGSGAPGPKRAARAARRLARIAGAKSASSSFPACGFGASTVAPARSGLLDSANAEEADRHWTLMATAQAMESAVGRRLEFHCPRFEAKVSICLKPAPTSSRES